MRFSTFRQGLLGFIILHCLTVAALLVVNYDVLSRGTICVVISVVAGQALTLGLALARKAIFHSDQTVAGEVVTMSAILPFAISGMVRTKKFIVLQGVFGAATLLHLLYSLGVMISGLIIYFAFDENVWLRPITTTPSPLPLEIIINRISFNTFYKKEHSPPEASTQDHSRHFCLEGYNCHMSNYSKNWRASIAPTVSQDENAQVRGDLEQTRRIIGDLDDRAFPPTSSSMRFGHQGQVYALTIGHTRTLSTTSFARPASLYMSSQKSSLASLVRLPDAAERRSSIVVGFYEV